MKRWPVTERRVLDFLAIQFESQWPRWQAGAAEMIASVRKARRAQPFAEAHAMTSTALDKAIISTGKTIRQFERRAENAATAEIRAWLLAEAGRRHGRLGLLTRERTDRDEREAARCAAQGLPLVEQQRLLDLVDAPRGRPPRDIGAAVDQADISTDWHALVTLLAWWAILTGQADICAHWATGKGVLTNLSNPVPEARHPRALGNRPGGACVPPNPAPSSTDSAGLAGRLRELRNQRQHAGATP